MAIDVYNNIFNRYFKHIKKKLDTVALLGKNLT